MSVEFLVTSLILVLAPGTGVIYTVATGLAAGRRASAAAALGCTFGIVPALLASVVGLAALLHTSAVLFQIVKFAGMAYLLFLAWQTLKEGGPLRLKAGKRQSPPLAAVVRTGFLINILNPKLSLFFLAFLPQFVTPGAQSVMAQMFTLGAAFMVMTFVVFLAYGAFTAFIGTKMLESETVMRWLRRTVAVTFAGFGLRLAFAER